MDNAPTTSTICTDRCSDQSQHDFYLNGGGFVWRRPKMTVYRPADTRPRAVLNRYPHNIIGAAVILFGRSWSVTWKGSRPRTSESLWREHLNVTRGYYLINRQYYPDLNRPQAAWSALRAWWTTRAHSGSHPPPT